MFSEKQVEAIVDLLYTLENTTKVYLGCDSVRFHKNDRWYARYATVAIVHMNGKNGCRIFSNVSIEPDYDLKKNRPKMRMMNEVSKVCSLYTQLAPFIDEYDVEIHLDIATNPKFGSNCAAQEAAGMVLGMTGIEPEKLKFKPGAWASSHGGDGIARGYDKRGGNTSYVN